MKNVNQSSVKGQQSSWLFSDGLLHNFQAKDLARDAAASKKTLSNLTGTTRA